MDCMADKFAMEGTDQSASGDSSGVNFFDILREHAVTQPDHPAIEDGNRVVSYKELNELTDRGAGNLCQCGVNIGDTVGVMLGNTADNLIISCVIARAGGVIFSIPPNLTIAEVAEKMRDTGSCLLVTDSFQGSNDSFSWLSPGEIFEDHHLPFDGRSSTGEAALILVETSGTTGKAKRFILSHTKMLQRSNRFRKIQNWTNKERYSSLIHLSFFTSRSYYGFMLHLGATVVIPQGRSYGDFVTFINEKNVSQLKVAPIFMRELLAFAKDKNLLFPNLRKLSVSGAPITADERAAVRAFLSPNLSETYGSNETGTVVYSDSVLQKAEPNSLGRVVDNVEAQIVDEYDNELPFGEVGLVRFKAPDFPTEYLENTEATKHTFRDGWVYPGDNAMLNNEGFLFFMGRADDAIINSGVNVYPIEIENILLKHPEVLEAAVFPWPHPLAGEVAVACVVTRTSSTAGKLQKFCAANAPPHKVPRYIMSVQSMPRSPMGKIMKNKLIEKMRIGLAREGPAINPL